MNSSPVALLDTNQSGAQLTIRALFTGMAFGAILSLCNLYVGLKLGWGIGMSLTAALLAFGSWQILQQTGRCKGLSMLETNISQTAASAAASIAAAGLIAPIPAYTILTGVTLTWPQLVIWTISVCLVGVVVSIGLRKQLIEVENLPFPSGFATGKTVKELYSHGRDTIYRLKLLGGMALIAAAVKIAEDLIPWITKIPVPGWISARPGGGLERAGLTGYSPANLGISIDPTLMMYGVGAIVGPRVGLSVLLGTLVSWFLLAPYAFEVGWAVPGAANESWWGNGLDWLLWPGVAIMVASALTSFAFSWRSILNSFRPARGSGSPLEADSEIMSKNWFIASLAAVTAISVILQTALFGITPWLATIGVLFTFMLALVAARVSGEVNVTPVTAMGKVTQLTFAVISPATATTNLMVANVTGGSAALCADTMHDLRAGKMLGAAPRAQYVAQLCGVLAGALVGCAGYVVLIPNPAEQLFTEQWPAPSAAAWMAVAELFSKGLDALPPAAVEAMTIGACLGILLAIGEKLLPSKAAKWVPSGPSMGLAFLIAPSIALALFAGSMAALLAGKIAPNWSTKFLIIAASGIIAGESLSGMFLAIIAILTGG